MNQKKILQLDLIKDTNFTTAFLSKNLHSRFFIFLIDIILTLLINILTGSFIYWLFFIPVILAFIYMHLNKEYAVIKTVRSYLTIYFGVYMVLCVGVLFNCCCEYFNFKIEY